MSQSTRENIYSIYSKLLFSRQVVAWVLSMMMAACGIPMGYEYPVPEVPFIEGAQVSTTPAPDCVPGDLQVETLESKHFYLCCRITRTMPPSWRWGCLSAPLNMMTTTPMISLKTRQLLRTCNAFQSLTCPQLSPVQSYTSYVPLQTALRAEAA